MTQVTPSKLDDKARKGISVAFVDIETSPNLGFVWGKWEQNVLQFEEEWVIIAFAVKYQGSNKVHKFALPDFPLYKKDPRSDAALVRKLWDVFDDADVIVAHNGDSFDIKKSNARFIANGLTPPSPYKQMDTKKMAKRYFNFTSNKLDDLGSYLGLGRKLATGGFKLWMDCRDGDPKAWNKMKTYNGQDVVLLEAVYLALLPWCTTYANRNSFEGTVDNCPRCSSKNMQRRGFLVRVGNKVQRYQCLDCGGWTVDTKTQKLNVQMR